tara:strand:+ start:1257 stop:1445 length:189 start_codon:yes stop_codon:yes gene_type:complete
MKRSNFISIDEILQDEKVRKELTDLITGLHKEAEEGRFPAEFNDWECRLANRIYVLVGGVFE